MDTRKHLLASSGISVYIDTILLKIISLGDCYGYSIAPTLAKITNEGCHIKEASIYSSLRRLESEQLINAYWGSGGQGGRRKYYVITEKGNKVLGENTEKWEVTKATMDKILSERTEQVSE